MKCQEYSRHIQCDKRKKEKTGPGCCHYDSFGKRLLKIYVVGADKEIKSAV